MRYKDLFKNKQTPVAHLDEVIFFNQTDIDILNHRILTERVGAMEYELTNRYFMDKYKVNFIHLSPLVSKDPNENYKMEIKDGKLFFYVSDKKLRELFNIRPTIQNPRRLNDKTREIAKSAFSVRTASHDSVVREFEKAYGIETAWIRGFNSEFSRNELALNWWFGDLGNASACGRPDNLLILLEYLKDGEEHAV